MNDDAQRLIAREWAAFLELLEGAGWDTLPGWRAGRSRTWLATCTGA